MICYIYVFFAIFPFLGSNIFFPPFYGIFLKKNIVNFEKIAKNGKFTSPYIREKWNFVKFVFLRNFLALGDKIPEMAQVKSARKVYFFSLKIEKMQNNAKIGQKIPILTENILDNFIREKMASWLIFFLLKLFICGLYDQNSGSKKFWLSNYSHFKVP